jgi:hypothetical protein
MRGDSTAAHFLERVFHCCHHAGHTSPQQGIGTWRGLSMMAARFERNVGRCSAGSFAGLMQRDDFCVWPAELRVMAFADDFPAANDHAADLRIWLNAPFAQHC